MTSVPIGMRTLTAILIFLLSINQVVANEIDSLKTKQDVQNFLVTHFNNRRVIAPHACGDIWFPDKKYDEDFRSDTTMVEDPLTGKMVKVPLKIEYDSTDPCFYKPDDNLYHSFAEVSKEMREHELSFYKADIDGDRQTDMVIEAGLIMVVMAIGDSFQAHALTMHPGLKFEGFVSLLDNSTAMQLRHDHALCETEEKRCGKVDTLVYKFNGFARYNPNFTTAAISKIDYYFHNSFGVMCRERYNCLEINKNGQCYLTSRNQQQYFAATLDGEKLSKLWNLIEYANVRSRKEWYGIASAHGEGGKFAVHFEDGTTKFISVRFYPPPLGLNYISKNISDISKELEWRPSQKPGGFDCPCTYSFSDSFGRLNPCECHW